MALLDFIELSDDIIDLSSDEETAKEDHSPTQHRATLHDTQDIFVIAGERMQHGQAAFFVDGEGRQESTESGNAVEATASSLVMEKGPLDTSAPCNRPRSPTAASFPGPTSTYPKALTFEGRGANLLRVKVKRHRKNYHTDTPRRILGLRRSVMVVTSLSKSWYLIVRGLTCSMASRGTSCLYPQCRICKDPLYRFWKLRS